MQSQIIFTFPSNIILTSLYSAENHEARLYNSHITSRETSLKVLHNRQNVPVEGFPMNPAALMRLTS